jgi:heme-degrading monooxygenase HmoA
MFLNMATAEPQPGKDAELKERMRSFAEALRPMPGLVNVFVLREHETGSLVGLSIWQDMQSFDSAMAKMTTLPSKTAVTKEPPKIRQFVEA